MRPPAIIRTIFSWRMVTSSRFYQQQQLRSLSSSIFETVNDVGDIKPDRLTLSSTFNRQTKRLTVDLEQLRRDGLNMYCCGPTVYADSHLGHAIAYIRCDLVRRTLQTYLGVPIYLTMNITDIDDKILAKAAQEGVNFREISCKYHQSFIDDLNSLGVLPADCYLKVTDHIDVIIDYILRLLDKGFAYINEVTGDVNFDYETFIASFNIVNARTNENSEQRGEARSDGKRSTKDFVLWKVSKPGQPSWPLEHGTTIIEGRPGWHVECSALSDYVFGSKLDLHFGGFDLIFPHHHCESCCSHAHDRHPGGENNQLYTTAGVWLHSGHLILRSEKMSKSLGNVVLIRDFLTKYSANLLRLLCIRKHYRSEIDFDEKLLLEMSAFDERLREFVNLIDFYIYKLCSSGGANVPPTKVVGDDNDGSGSSLLDNLIAMAPGDDEVALPSTTTTTPCLTAEQLNDIEREIVAGVLNDLDLNVGLEAMINLARRFSMFMADRTMAVAAAATDETESISKLLLCMKLRRMVRRWTQAIGLDYYGGRAEDEGREQVRTGERGREHFLALLEQVVELRAASRKLALEAIKASGQRKPQEGEESSLRHNAQLMLNKCDATRTFLEANGYKLKDQPSKSSN